MRSQLSQKIVNEIYKTHKMKKLLFLIGTIAFLGTTSCKKDSEYPVDPGNTPRTQVPDEIVGAWEAGSIDFVLWENYREGYYAGRNAIPSREAMVFNKNG